jgi:hypothetical protein
MDITNIPAPRVEFIDKRTGLMAREWYLFFLNLFNLTGAGSNPVSLLDLQQGPPSVTIDDVAGQLSANELGFAPAASVYDDLILRLQDQLNGQPVPTVEDLKLIRQLVETAPPYPEPTPDNSYLIQPSAITVGASPFTYTNSNLYTVDIIVEGGGVSLLEFSRDGSTWYSTGSFYGMFALSKGDRLRATYASAPNMTLIPR